MLRIGQRVRMKSATGETGVVVGIEGGDPGAISGGTTYTIRWDRDGLTQRWYKPGEIIAA